jgi:hypothetical protein
MRLRHATACLNRTSGLRRIVSIYGGGSKGSNLVTIKQSALIGKCRLTDSCSKTQSAKEWVMSADCGFFL